MKSYKVLLFIAIAIACLAGICALWPREGVKIAGVNLHFPTLNKILVPEKELNLDSIVAEQKIEMEHLSSLKDSISYYQTQLDSSNIKFWLPANDSTYFDELFATMETAQIDSQNVRILHYGDSQIEMDRISCRLRAYMQEKFGGGGPGLVPISTIIPSYAITQYAEGAFVHLAPFGDSTVVRGNGNYGPMVQCFRLEGNSVSNYRAATHSSADALIKQFSNIKLLFHNNDSIWATLDNRNDGYSNHKSSYNMGVQMLQWDLDSASNSVRISLKGNAEIYGVMLDNGPGVSVDNIPMRGCSGQQFTLINKQQLKEAYQLMNVRMIILQFGGNSMPYLKTDKSIESYCKSIGNQIERLKECCPRCKFLFIGPSDMSTSINGELQTYPYMEKVISALQETANNHGIAYWSIYHAMGGYNSMLAWVSKGWAGSDYIHFSPKGAQIMGNRLAEAFDQLYDYYQLRKGITEDEFAKIDSIGEIDYEK